MSIAHARARRPLAGVAVALASFTLGCGAAAVAAGGPDDPETTASAARPVVTVTSEPTAVMGPVTAPSVSATPEVPQVTATQTYPIDEADSIWVVVNKSRPLDPEAYAPADLVTLAGLPGGAAQRMRTEAADALVSMRAAAADDDAAFAVSTAYRSHGFQASLFGDYAARRGAAAAETFSARPGYSEHQTGLAVDVYGTAACRIKRCFADEAAGEWIAAHGWEHGFIVRYPEGEQDVTGYVFEPWHVRYVGVDLATAMHGAGATTLEEWFDLPAAPDYG